MNPPRVPALNEPPAAPAPPASSTYTLRGVISEQGTDRGLEGARVETLNGANAGKTTLTDGAGAYTLSGLTGETFRLRASMTGFNSGEQNVTVPDTTRADLALRRTSSAACAYTIAPSGTMDVPFGLGQSPFTVTRTSGTCPWQASSDAGWISLSSTSGSGDAESHGHPPAERALRSANWSDYGVVDGRQRAVDRAASRRAGFLPRRQLHGRRTGEHFRSHERRLLQGRM